MSKKAYFSRICVNGLNNSVRTDNGFLFSCIWSKPNSPLVSFNKSFNISVIFFGAKNCLDWHTSWTIHQYSLSANSQSIYWPTIFHLLLRVISVKYLTEDWLSTIYWVLISYQPKLGEVSAKYWWSIGELKAISANIHIIRYIDRYIGQEYLQ